MKLILALLIFQGLANIEGKESRITKKRVLAPAKTVCYKRLGCFASNGDFFDIIRRPISLAPQSPEKIDTKFLLFTRKGGSTYLKYDDVESLGHFSAKKPTKVICHGLRTSVAISDWIRPMKDAFLKAGDVNVILVDWSKGNKERRQATSNTRVVGAVITRLIRWLEDVVEADRTTFHIIGHSLGAHIAGYAGSGLKDSTKALGQITGLDPSAPYFENMPASVRLDPTDASFVEVIHTDSEKFLSGGFKLKGGFGLKQPSGHVDFYPNGGKNQPGCHDKGFYKKLFSGKLIKAVTCDHLRSSFLYIATLDNPSLDYRGFQCRSYKEFKKGKCLSCKGDRCAEIGERAIKWNPKGRKEVKMYLKTTKSPPFFLHHFSAKVTLCRRSRKTVYGKIYIRLWDKSGVSTGKMTIISDAKRLRPGSSHQSLVTSPKEVSDIRKVQIQWKNKRLSRWFSRKKICVASVEVVVAKTQKKFVFKAPGRLLNSKAHMTLKM